jgi:hypothetical protein
MRYGMSSGLEDFDMVSSNRGPGSEKEGKDEMRTGSERNPAQGGGAKVDPRVQNEIGKHLRAIYDDVINEPVPNRFMELLEKLERSSKKS